MKKQTITLNDSEVKPWQHQQWYLAKVDSHFVLVLLAQLAHNLVVWVKGWLAALEPELATFGVQHRNSKTN